MRSALIVTLLAMSLPVAHGFEISFDFSNVRPCAGGALRITASPEFALTNVPAETQELDFKLVDISANYAHGGSAVPYTGESTMPADSFKYVGPCPFTGQTHTYEWTVTALDATGAALGTATAQADFAASR